jgi:hypothetical protein
MISLKKNLLLTYEGYSFDGRFQTRKKSISKQLIFFVIFIFFKLIFHEEINHS